MPRKSQVADNANNSSVEDKVAKKVVSGEVAMNADMFVGGGNASQLTDLLQIINSLQSQVQSLLTEKEKSKSSVNIEIDEDDEFDKVEIRPDTYIKVISICPFPLNLSTMGGGKGKVFSFKTFGQIKRIMYSDLLQIMENHQNFLSKGYFYIMNKAVIRKNGLDAEYANILTKDHIEMILSGGDNDTIISLFKSANVDQQKLIVQMIIDSMISGKEVDLNLIDKLSRTSEINIQEKYEDTKEYVSSLEAGRKK